MKVLSFKKDKWSSKYMVEFENQEKYKISIDQVVKYNIEENKDIDYEDFKIVLNEENEKDAYNKALDLISLKDYSSLEIKNKLLQKGYEDIVIDIVLDKLKNYNFINDEKYATNYCEYALKYKKHGKNKIIYTLKQKGITSNILSSLDFNEDIEYEKAMELCNKKLKTLKDDDKKKQKIYRYLLSRGYNNTTIMKIINKL